MSCGMIAMKNAGVTVNKYISYEIDKFAIKVSSHNFPEIKQCGDVFAADFTKWLGIDYLIGGSPCFTKGHLVLTKDGYKDVSEIQIGDMVLTHAGEYHKVVRTNTRIADTYAVKIVGYPEFITTAGHPFYTIKKRKASYSEYVSTHSQRIFSEEPEWTPASALTSNHFCGQHLKASAVVDNDFLTTELCWLLGRYLADGHIRKDKRKERKNSFIYQLIISVGKDKLNDFKAHVKERHYSCYKHTQSVYRCTFSSQQLVEYVIENRFGDHSYNKRIPEFIYSLSYEKRNAFLEGYLSGDGYYNKNSDSWSMGTVSKELAFGLQRLITTLYQTNAGVSIAPIRDGHMIDNRIIKANYPLYIVQFKKQIRKQSVAYIQNNIIWTQVKAVKPTGKKEVVYNIEVEKDHSYTVNNCIVHNCTHWSIAQTKNRETEASGVGWELFSQYVRALREAAPKFFIYENNKSMSAAIRKSISDTFGFEPICINSALVSAQNRERLYWVGKCNDDGTYSKVNVEQPQDKGIMLKTILEIVTSEKGYTLKPLSTKEMEYMVRTIRDGRNHFDFGYIQDATKDKGKCLTANVSKGVPYNVCCVPIRIGTIENSLKNPAHNSKQYRVYSPEGKSTTLCGQGGGVGAKTGLYACPINIDNKHNDDMVFPIYKVENGMIGVNDSLYPIKLPDGYYIIRKLTVNECKRLQTVPDWYDMTCLSDTQAYKCLGNGWTVDVISHLIKATLKYSNLNISEGME